MLACPVLGRWPLAPRLAYHAYNLVAELATPAVAAYAVRRSGLRGLQHAFTLAPTARPRASRLFWVHGASVGETCSTLPLVRALLASDGGASVLMTASTTVLALLPLALGMGRGSEANAPLARAMLGAVIGGGLMTLVVVPALYTFFGARLKPAAAAVDGAAESEGDR